MIEIALRAIRDDRDVAARHRGRVEAVFVNVVLHSAAIARARKARRHRNAAMRAMRTSIAKRLNAFAAEVVKWM